MSNNQRRILNDIVELGLDPNCEYSAKELAQHRRDHEATKREAEEAAARQYSCIFSGEVERCDRVHTPEEIAGLEEHCRQMDEANALHGDEERIVDDPTIVIDLNELVDHAVETRAAPANDDDFDVCVGDPSKMMTLEEIEAYASRADGTEHPLQASVSGADLNALDPPPEGPVSEPKRQPKGEKQPKNALVEKPKKQRTKKEADPTSSDG